MDTVRYQRLKLLFLEAVSRAPAQREEFVREAAEGDEELLDRLSDLLRAHAAAGEIEPPQPAPWSDVDPSGYSAPGLRIVRPIGAGSSGIVFEAVQESNGRRVALKVVRPEFDSPSARSRARREAELMERLDHPGIAALLECGEARTPSGARPFCAMELVDGESFDHWAAGRDERERLTCFLAICDAVQAAHDRGVVHRDLKPSNVIVGAMGLPKVVDFGIAKALDAVEATSVRTDTGELLGTLAYASPEQVCGQRERVGPRSDVFSLGAMLFETVAGQPPHAIDGLPLFEAIRIVAEHAPSSLRRVRGDAPRALDAICDRALARRPEDRYASVGDLAADVSRYLAGGTPVVVRAAERRRWMRIGAVALALVAIGFVIRADGSQARASSGMTTDGDSARPLLGGEPVPASWLVAPAPWFVTPDEGAGHHNWSSFEVLLPPAFVAVEAAKPFRPPPTAVIVQAHALGRLDEIRATHEESAEADLGERPPPHVRGRTVEACSWLALVELAFGDPERARELVERASDAVYPFRARSPRGAVVDAVHARVLAALGEHDAARTALESAMAAAERHDADQCAAEVRTAAAICAWRRGDMEAARDFAEDALRRFRLNLTDGAPQIERLVDLLARLQG